MSLRQDILETCAQILRERRPNLLRLYLNPFVAQTCMCLDRYVRSTWPIAEEYQSFIANSFDEALSGAIKLARYAANMAGRPTAGLILDPGRRLGPYARAAVPGGSVVFVPGLEILDSEAALAGLDGTGQVGFIVLVPDTLSDLERHAHALGAILSRDAPRLIIAVDRAILAALRKRGPSTICGQNNTMPPLPAPDIVLFDESFVDRSVPFSAFTARKSLYDHWNRPGKTTFHSTTYQPNTVSTLHFLRCLEAADPAFHAALVPDLARIAADPDFCGAVFRRLYSPSLFRMIRMTGFASADVHADGDFVTINGRKVFDAVSGVACSIRGHNPAGYVDELQRQHQPADRAAALTERLHTLTGMEHLLPAVSGASAVESALKLALVAQYPRRHVLALKAGFGGKTLLALTGTANPAYKERVDPLYPDVLYVDPFAPDAAAQIDAALAAQPVAVIQMELIQAVGGVRRIPEHVVRHLAARRRDAGYLLLVDEVQTGMYRTGPFSLARAMGVAPDLLLLGKGTSDMMFPFALVLYSAAVHDQLERLGSDLPALIRQRHAYEQGYATVLNVLEQADRLQLSRQVAASAALFDQLLSAGLASCPAVRAVRVHGLLIGIELAATRWPQRWFGKRLYSLYLYSMLRHQHFPALVGFCQYEPNVLKITPSLTIAPEQTRALCATIVDVLRRPLHRLLAAVLGGLLQRTARSRAAQQHLTIPEKSV
jgi:acetylornithine/succinyldiaminopimelate/putrescine aminotransferase